MSDGSKVWHVFCDEATSGRYTVIGGLWCRTEEVIELHTEFTKYRRDNNLKKELKWTKVSKPYIEKYKGFVDVFFDNHSMEFRCIVIDTHKLNIKKYHRNDVEAFSKFFNQMLRPIIRSDNIYFVYVDERNQDTETVLLERLKFANWGLKTNPVFKIKSMDSKLLNFIQLSDLLIGAVQSEWNDETTAIAKLALRQHILDRIGFDTFIQDSGSWFWKFNMFHWKSKAELNAVG